MVQKSKAKIQDSPKQGEEARKDIKKRVVRVELPVQLASDPMIAGRVTCQRRS